MPILTPSYLPPPPGLGSPSPSCASSNATFLSAPRSQPPSPPTSPEQDAVSQRSDVPLKQEHALKIPFVKLDVPAIQDDMAASMAVALLGHVLFLKSQVPFPVAQLGRVPGASSASASVSRAAKKRSDMITAFDELSSHLHTTFSALSTALARNPTHRNTDTVYLAMVLGPTIGAPKSRVVLALEGLEVKIWGLREDVDRPLLTVSSSNSTSKNEDNDNGDGSSDDGSEAGDTGTEDDDDTDGDSGDAGESPPASEPPSSRSPSPSLDEPSRPSSPVPVSSIRRPLRPSLSPKSSPSSSSSTSQPYLAPKPTRTYAEEQQTLRAAERLLARTLANAYAEGGGMASELAPTQTHVLLRAPRRFSHPAWLPRQNVSATLDNMLRDFLVDSGLGDTPLIGAGTGTGDGKTQRRRGIAGVKTEGVLVTCQNSLDDGSNDTSPRPAATDATTVTEVREEEDELIWWAWDGKLMGFAEW